MKHLCMCECLIVLTPDCNDVKMQHLFRLCFVFLFLHVFKSNEKKSFIKIIVRHIFFNL